MQCSDLCDPETFTFSLLNYIRMNDSPFALPRLVVSSLEALESCYAVGSASEKASKSFATAVVANNAVFSKNLLRIVK